MQRVFVGGCKIIIISPVWPSSLFNLTHLTIDGIAKVLLGHPYARRGEEDEDGDAVVHPATERPLIHNSSVSNPQIDPMCNLHIIFDHKVA